MMLRIVSFDWGTEGDGYLVKFSRGKGYSGTHVSLGIKHSLVLGVVLINVGVESLNHSD